jgi:hypothetical protein
VGEDECDPSRGTLSRVSQFADGPGETVLIAGPWDGGASFGSRPRASSSLNSRTRRSQPSPSDNQPVNHKDHNCSNHRYEQTP